MRGGTELSLALRYCSHKVEAEEQECHLDAVREPEREIRERVRCGRVISQAILRGFAEASVVAKGAVRLVVEVAILPKPRHHLPQHHRRRQHACKLHKTPGKRNPEVLFHSVVPVVTMSHRNVKPHVSIK